MGLQDNWGFSVGGGNSLFNELHEHLFSRALVCFIYLFPFVDCLPYLFVSEEMRDVGAGRVIVCCLLLFLDNDTCTCDMVCLSFLAAGFFSDTQ